MCRPTRTSFEYKNFPLFVGTLQNKEFRPMFEN